MSNLPTANPLYQADQKTAVTPNPISAPAAVAAGITISGPPEGNKEEYEEIREQVSLFNCGMCESVSPLSS